MRKFNVEVEGTKFTLEVEEYKQVPMILDHGGRRTWSESGHREAMSVPAKQ